MKHMTSRIEITDSEKSLLVNKGCLHTYEHGKSTQQNPKFATLNPINRIIRRQNKP